MISLSSPSQLPLISLSSPSHLPMQVKLGDLPELIVNNSAVKAMRNVEWFAALPKHEKLVAVNLPCISHASPMISFSSLSCISRAKHGG